MFGKDNDDKPDLLEGSVPVKVDIGSEIVSFSSEEAFVISEENVVIVSEFGNDFTPSKVHLPTTTMSAIDNSLEKSEQSSFKIFNVKKYSKIVNSGEKRVIKSGEDLTLPYTEIKFEE